MKARIRFIKALDGAIGPLLLRLVPRSGTGHPPVFNMRRILVMRPGGIGDAALLLPVLKEVKKCISGVKIDVLCEPRNAGVFKATPYVDGIFFYDRPISLSGLFRQSYDIIFDTEQSHFLTAILSCMLKADLRIGYATQDRGRVYDRAIPYSHSRYEAESFWDLFSSILPISPSLQWDFPYFSSGKDKDDAIDRIIKVEQPFVCFFPGATVKERFWPESHWVKVADHLRKAGYRVVLLGGGAEIPFCKRLVSQMGNQGIIDFSGKFSLLETSGLLKEAALLVSTDSGILHVGVLSDTPTVSLFGSGITEKWAPRGVKHRIIRKDLPCSPCTRFGTTPGCQNKVICMTEITGEEVASCSLELLKTEYPKRFGATS